MQIVEIPIDTPRPHTVCYDEEWLAVLRETHGMMNLQRRPTKFPTSFAAAPASAAEHRAAVADALAQRADSVDGAAAAPAAAQQTGTGGQAADGADGAAANVAADSMGQAAQRPLYSIPPRLFTRTVDTTRRGQGQAPVGVPRNPQTEEVLRILGKPWNLSQGGSSVDAAQMLAGSDLLGQGGGQSGRGVPDGQGAAATQEEPMFDAVEIHNFDPYAFNDAQAGAEVKRPKLGALLEQAGRGGQSAADGQAGADAAASGGAAQNVVPASTGNVANPEELDIGSDSQ